MLKPTHALFLGLSLILASNEANAFGRGRSSSTPASTPAPPVVVTSTPAPSTGGKTGMPTPSPTPNPTATPVSSTSTGETGLKYIYDEFLSVFENSSLTLDYSYIDAEGDGRGYTAGRAGFTSRDGDMLEVIQDYLKLEPSSQFSTLVSTLTNLTNKDSGSTSGLSTLPSIWKAAAQDPVFRGVQDEVSDELYYTPAVVRGVQLNVVSPIGVLCLYDASLEHGMDGDDGVNDMISRMPARSTFATEYAWIKAFNAVRRATLLNPKDSSTKAVWSASVGRVDTLDQVLASGNYNLVTPITIDPFGDTFVVVSSPND
jgi:chitosanase